MTAPFSCHTGTANHRIPVDHAEMVCAVRRAMCTRERASCTATTFADRADAQRLGAQAQIVRGALAVAWEALTQTDTTPDVQALEPRATRPGFTRTGLVALNHDRADGAA